MAITLNGSTGITDANGGTVLNTTAAQTLTNKTITGATITGGTVAAGQLTGDVAAAQITTALNASGSAPIYACRAWASFDAGPALVVRSSGNVASIVRNSQGNFTVTFTTAMANANYASCITPCTTNSGTAVYQISAISQLAGSVTFSIRNQNGNQADLDFIALSIFA